MMNVDKHEPPTAESQLLMDEEDLRTLISQTFEYSEDSDDSPYFIASACIE